MKTEAPTRWLEIGTISHVSFASSVFLRHELYQNVFTSVKDKNMIAIPNTKDVMTITLKNGMRQFKSDALMKALKAELERKNWMDYSFKTAPKPRDFSINAFIDEPEIISIKDFNEAPMCENTFLIHEDGRALCAIATAQKLFCWSLPLEVVQPVTIH